VLRYFGEADDRLLVVNLGCDLDLAPSSEPLLAPPRGARWASLWSSESPRYGGQGTPPLETTSKWHIPGEAAVLVGPVPVAAADGARPGVPARRQRRRRALDQAGTHADDAPE
jgi:maltooligosyltrehalose trehalohydrolase